jgi:hypothetical protein
MRTFLVIIDESEEALSALRYAARRAAAVGGAVHLLALVAQQNFSAFGAVQATIEAEARDRAEMLAHGVAGAPEGGVERRRVGARRGADALPLGLGIGQRAPKLGGWRVGVHRRQAIDERGTLGAMETETPRTRLRPRIDDEARDAAMDDWRLAGAVGATGVVASALSAL